VPNLLLQLRDPSFPLPEGRRRGRRATTTPLVRRSWRRPPGPSLPLRSKHQAFLSPTVWQLIQEPKRLSVPAISQGKRIKLQNRAPSTKTLITKKTDKNPNYQEKTQQIPHQDSKKLRHEQRTKKKPTYCAQIGTLGPQYRNFRNSKKPKNRANETRRYLRRERSPGRCQGWQPGRRGERRGSVVNSRRLAKKRFSRGSVRRANDHDALLILRACLLGTPLIGLLLVEV
jgi:hypothetical protein